MKNYLSILLLVACFNGYAQDDDLPKNEKIESLKIAFITERLSLTTKEAEMFWPVFNQFDKEVKSIRQKQRSASTLFKSKTTPTEAESEKFITEQLLLKQQETELLKKYIPSFKKVIPTAKVAMLLSIEHEFKMELLKKIKDRRRN